MHGVNRALRILSVSCADEVAFYETVPPDIQVTKRSLSVHKMCEKCERRAS